MLITAQLLVACGADPAHPAPYVGPLNNRLTDYAITTPLRLAHFLAQILVESDRLRTAEEYASGAAYEGRRDLGNTQPGDGVRFKGRGLIQITGRSNYAALSKAFGVDYVAHPAWLERPDDAVHSALFYWDAHKLNQWADQDNVLAISQIINLGSIPRPGAKRQLPNGLNARKELLALCKAALGVVTPGPQTPVVSGPGVAAERVP